MKIRTIKTIPLFLILGLFACKQTHEEEPKTQIPAWIPYDESAEIAENTNPKGCSTSLFNPKSLIEMISGKM